MANLFSPPTPTDVKGGRFCRNGTSHNVPPALHADGQSTARAGWTGRLGLLWDKYAPFRNPFSTKGKDSLDGDGDEGNGVHEITKKTDYWFNRELSLDREEQEARRELRRRGLPRHDVEHARESSSPNKCSGWKSLELFRPMAAPRSGEEAGRDSRPERHSQQFDR